MQVLAGDPSRLNNRPVVAWDSERVAFLSAVSKAILADPDARKLPDAVTFAYWARKGNLAAIETRTRVAGRVSMGLGLVFHVSPSNAPVNFAFSMAFGLLAGNSCVIRLPSAETATATIIVRAVRHVLAQPEHEGIRGALLLVRYARDDEVNRFWTGIADGRVVWGGDETVRQFRRYPAPPRAREVSFADRYSLCTLRPIAVLELDDAGLKALCSGLYNDIYLMDQAACSSPQLVAWVGDAETVGRAQDRLWPALVSQVKERYDAPPIRLMDKFVRACESAATNAAVHHIQRHGNLLYRVALETLGPNPERCRGIAGTVHEVVLTSLDDLAPFINEIYQTLTYFGYGREELTTFVQRHGLRGIDRIVPVGRALDMDVIWDGYEIVTGLSRTVDIR